MNDSPSAPQCSADGSGAATDINASWTRFQLDQLANSIAYARLRCWATANLITSACNFLDPNRVMAQKALKERQLTEHEQADLESGIRGSLSDLYRATLPSTVRQGTDRLGSNLGELLDVHRARVLASELLTHPLRARRLAGITLLRHIGCTADEGDALRGAFITYGDEEALALLTRIPGQLPDFTCCEFLYRILYPAKHDSDYLAALVIARLWTEGKLDHEHSAYSHGIAYVRAMGRVRDCSRENLLCLIVGRTSDPELLSMSASVAGRLQLLSAVDTIERRIAKLLEVLPAEDCL